MRLKRIICCVLCLMIVAVSVMPVPVQAKTAQKDNKVVRVGWYESAFHRTDQFGRRSGYGYEYQQRIAAYTGWTYEYVEGSWSELFEKLVNGEIDLLSDVSYTEERAQKILYSSEEMGSEGYHVFISPNNTEIRPDDFSSLNGKKVGVNKNSIQEKLFVAWAKEHNVTPQIIESTEKSPVLIQTLENGELDALVTLDTYGNTADIVPVCKVGFAESYFGISMERPDLKQELDSAMNRIFEENRDYNQELTAKYNKAGAVNSFLTADEVEWLNEHRTVKVGYRDDFLPFCTSDEETGELKGALGDFLRFASTCEKNAKIVFEPKAFDSTQAGLKALADGEIDCFFPVAISTYDGEKMGVIITDPFVKTQMYAAVRNSDRKGVSKDSIMKVAMIKGIPSYETFMMEHFPDWPLEYFDDIEAGFKAVADGAADCIMVSNYRLNQVSSLCNKYKLATLATGEIMDMSFAVKREDDCLYSVINKAKRLMPETTINSSLTNYGFRDEKVTFLDYLKDNLLYFVITVTLVIILIMILLYKNLISKAKAADRQQIISEAERDSLTGLYTWNFFLIYANRLHRESPDKPMDAVVMNIDRFHSINALHGREFGDKILSELGDEIKKFLAKTEGIASRFEADRFDIYCVHRDDWQNQLERFQARLDRISKNSNIHLRMGVRPWQEGMEPMLQFDCARTACNMIRGDFKTRVFIYDEEMGRREERDQRLLNDLARALEQKEFKVYYQPKYNIQSDKPTLSSAEALVRWKHPELGMISPGEFIPLFERNGQISAIDNYVWMEAARQMAEWRDKHGVVIPVSVNLSRVDVFDPELCDILDSIAALNGIDHKDLKLEVTESAYTENADELLNVINQLRGKGYEIEMDDFGSGYSSLNMLSSMPIDVLKMDIEFIRNIERNEKDLRLVELIVDIARYLKVPVIAEGVETKQQLDLLRNAGCDIVQGFYFSRPLSAEDFEQNIIEG